MPQSSEDSPSLMDTIRAHPVRSVLLATPVPIIMICFAIAQSWQSFTDKKIPDWFRQNLGWVFIKFPIWQLWSFAASTVAVYCVVVYVLFRPRPSKASRASRAKYLRVLSQLAETKKQKASDVNSGGYSILASIAADARERSRDEALRPKPNLIAQFTYVGIYGMTGGAGITVRLEIRNAGTPSIADKFTATLSSEGFSDELFPAPMPPNAVYADETGGMRTIKPSDTLYQKLRQPIQSGNRVIGFLFYFAKGVSPAELTAREPTEIVIRFRDVTFREYSVSSEGVKPLYPPGVVDQFAALSDSEEANATSVNAKIEQVRFYDTWEGPKPYLLMLVLVLVKNTGAPTAVSGWRLSFKSPGLNIDHFRTAGRGADRHLGDGVTLFKKDSLIERLDLTPVSPGIPVRGWLDYYFENKKLGDLQGKEFTMHIAFQDAFGREGAADSSGLVQGPDKGVRTAYFPGVEPLRSGPEESDKLIKAFVEIEALPISARTENRTQLGNTMKGGPVFRGKCIFSIRNPNPTHGFTGVGCRLISIDPPFRSGAGHRAMTENYTIRRVKFSIDDIEDNKLRGNQTAHVHILTAERKPFAEPKSLKNITINIEGKWPEESINEFTPPKSEHVLTLEVFGDGLQTKQERFMLSFSEEFKDDVFRITKLPPA